MNIKIKRIHDLAEIVNLNQFIFPQDLLDVSANVYGWISYDSGKPNGFCTCTDIGYGILFLSRAGLLPDYRGGGIHKRFITVRKRFGVTHGYNTMITYVRRDNYSSLANLIKYGFEMYEPEYDYAGKDFIYLRYKL